MGIERIYRGTDQKSKGQGSVFNPGRNRKPLPERTQFVEKMLDGEDRPSGRIDREGPEAWQREV